MYSEKKKAYNIVYQKENMKRVPLDVQKEYYEEVLKPAAERVGEPVNTFIKKAIEERIAQLDS